MKTALLLIDIQKGLDEWAYYGKERSNPLAEDHCAEILNHFREKNQPVFHVKHNSINQSSPLHPDKSGNQIKTAVTPLLCEKVYEKTVNSAFIGTQLEPDLKEARIDHLVIVGLTAEHCISSSVRMAANLGFAVTLISDATAAFSKNSQGGSFIPAEQVHEVTLANLDDEFAKLMTTDDFLNA